MSIDARYVASEHIETDVCIVGSGPAGITLAREFIGHKTRVTILESGAVEFDQQTQNLAAGTTVGDPLIPPFDAVHRQFGGLSNIWVLKVRKDQYGVRYAMFDESDFEPRECIANSGWPFSRSSLIPYYEKAQQVCKLGPPKYQPSDWLGDDDHGLPFDGDSIQTSMFQFGRRSAFHHDYRLELERAANITIYHYANVVEVQTDEASKAIRKARVACLNGNQFWVAAKVIVLACGAFENARILLLSNKQDPHGVGNQHGVVGRYFHDHPTAISGYFTPSVNSVFDRAGIYDLRRVDSTAVQGYLRIPKAVLEREQLSNINTMVFPCPDARETRALKSFKCAGENIWSIVNNLRAKSANLRKKIIPVGFWGMMPQKCLNMILGLDAIAKAVVLWLFHSQPLFLQFGSGGGWSELAGNAKRFERFEMRHFIEQTPHPDNRVTLGQEVDALGCPKLEVHWRWHRSDAEALSRTVKFLAKELSEKGLGQFDYELNEEGLVDIVTPAGSHHLMGTTRMHNDPRFGVVDANCQVHGVRGLYIAGSSTFPTGGYANPTLTIVAMSLRMADHIKQEIS